MKKILLTAMLFIVVPSSSSWALPAESSAVPYQCTNKQGKLGLGTGRVSTENEFSSFIRKTVAAGEYVVFKYDGQGKEYWFKAINCIKAK